MIKPNPYVALRDSNYIAKGRQQFVYEHPSDPSALIKITMLEKLASEEPFRTRASAAATLRPFLREFKEYILLKARNQSPNTLLPACEVRGIVQTDIGLEVLA